jgi:hypothetical protein
MRTVVLVPALIGALALGQAAPSPAPASTPIDAATLLRDLRTLSADDMQGRAFGTEGGARARRLVIDRFGESGVVPFDGGYLQPVVGGPAARAGGEIRRGANVIGLVPGTAAPRRYIVVSAHYDHVGVRNGVVYNGADDNASGTAALFAIAAHFVRAPASASLIIAAFDGEEAGLLGSRAFVRALPVDRAAIVIDVNLDMIGRDPSNTLWITGTARQPAWRPLIARVAARAPVRLRVGHDGGASGEDWTRDSDHYAFLEAGLPALYVGVEDYDQLHEPTDDYETMTYGFYVRAVETVIDLIREIDAAPRAAGAGRS